MKHPIKVSCWILNWQTTTDKIAVSRFERFPWESKAELTKMIEESLPKGCKIVSLCPSKMTIENPLLV